MKYDETYISFEQIIEARKIAAKIVSLHGDMYLPLFTRLNDELQKLDERKKIKELALLIAD